jgi:ubiquinol-cytochrome c reductase cytochrome c1 subunit
MLLTSLPVRAARRACPEAAPRQAPDMSTDPAALQNGAKLFVNYCLNCHGASYMRYNRLQDIGLSEQQIKDNLMFTAEKVGEPMRIAMQRKDAKVWFGAAPPDLTVIARPRLRVRQRRRLAVHLPARLLPRRESRPTGWNNVVSRTSACRMCSGNCRASR